MLNTRWAYESPDGSITIKMYYANVIMERARAGFSNGSQSLREEPITPNHGTYNHNEYEPIPRGYSKSPLEQKANSYSTKPKDCYQC